MAKFLLTDQVGTLRAVADTSGAIVKRIDYDSFGNIIADSNPAFAVPFGFAGGLHDRDTGLVRFGARDYSPELWRFVAKDPIDFAGGDTNLYAYVMSDPVNFVDPTGLITPRGFWTGGGPGGPYSRTGRVVGATIGGAIGAEVGAEVVGTAGAAIGGVVGGPGGAVLGAFVGVGAGGTAGGFVGGAPGGQIGAAIGGLFDDPPRLSAPDQLQRCH